MLVALTGSERTLSRYSGEKNPPRFTLFCIGHAPTLSRLTLPVTQIIGQAERHRNVPILTRKECPLFRGVAVATGPQWGEINGESHHTGTIVDHGGRQGTGSDVDADGVGGRLATESTFLAPVSGPSQWLAGRAGDSQKSYASSRELDWFDF